jgi:hypothetical protein
MIAFLVRSAVKCLVLAGLVYVMVFVKVGRFTTFEHLRKIAGTTEAREFGTEVARAVDRAKTNALQSAGNPTPHRTN